MYCPNCGTPNAVDAIKCVNCGKPLPKLSPTGEPLPIGRAETPDRPTDWPPEPQPDPYFRPGQPGSQYSYQTPPPPGYAPPYGYNAPMYSYTTPADRVGVAGADAGFWPRLGAYLIDSLLVGILISLVTGVPLVVWAVNFISQHQSELLPVCDSSGTGFDRYACNQAVNRILLDRGEIGAAIGLFLGLTLLAFVIYALYYSLQTARGATVGKRVFGLRVVTAEGQVPGFGRALLRHTIGYLISSIFLLGFIWIAFDPQHQGWHDKIAGTYVVRA